MKRAFLLLLLLLLLAAPLVAQEAEPIKACEDDDILIIAIVVGSDDFATLFKAIRGWFADIDIAQVGTMSDNFFQLHELWHEDMYEKMPRCVESVELSRHITGFVDDGLIAVLNTQLMFAMQVAGTNINEANFSARIERTVRSSVVHGEHIAFITKQLGERID